MPIFTKLALYLDTIGLGATIRYRAAKFRDDRDSKKGIPPGRAPISITPKGYRFPIWMRPGTSDIHVFRQIFVHREYEFPMGMAAEEVRLVVDCGANVGFTSVFMLNKFPNARVIAVEPDPENARICLKNLEPFGSRAELIREGVWSHETGLRLIRSDGPDFQWAIRVEEAAPGEPSDLRATSIPAILERSGLTAIDLLKIDIEGSEKVVFSADCDWLARVKNIAMELHGEDCEAAFFRAMGGYRYHQATSGELTICTDITPKAVDSDVSSRPIPA